jgi:hypothetical protein
MAAISSLQAVSAGLLNAAEQNTAVAATLIKKAAQADKDLVNTLLPLNTASQGGVDIRA